jgi:protein-L-isoaspartate O-methyltransferase
MMLTQKQKRMLKQRPKMRLNRIQYDGETEVNDDAMENVETEAKYDAIDDDIH